MAAGPAVAKHTTHNDQAQRMTQPHHTATLNSPHGPTTARTAARPQARTSCSVRFETSAGPPLRPPIAAPYAAKCLPSEQTCRRVRVVRERRHGQHGWRREGRGSAGRARA